MFANFSNERHRKRNINNCSKRLEDRKIACKKQ